MADAPWFLVTVSNGLGAPPEVRETLKALLGGDVSEFAMSESVTIIDLSVKLGLLDQQAAVIEGEAYDDNRATLMPYAWMIVTAGLISDYPNQIILVEQDLVDRLRDMGFDGLFHDIRPDNALPRIFSFDADELRPYALRELNSHLDPLETATA